MNLVFGDRIVPPNCKKFRHLVGSDVDDQLFQTKLSGLDLQAQEPFMQTFNIHDAKTQLSRLVEQAAKGESFVIAKAGKPMVKVMALAAPESSQMKRIGFLAGQVTVPAARVFNALGSEEIVAMFACEE